MLNPGDRIGKYEVTSCLGQGGMGTVYLCRDTALARNVAVKVVNPRIQGAKSALDRFAQEARAIAQLSGPHVVQVHEFSPEGDPPHLVTEFVRGRTLGQLVKEEGPLPVGLVFRCASQMLLALQEAHGAGIIHRDIKPANIMQSETGSYKLMDFGLARSLDPASRMTTEGTVLGTVAYLSPETARGEPATARSDLHALGVTLYEMLAGKIPRGEESPLKLIQRIVNEPLPPISIYRDGVPARAAAWLDRLVAHDPGARFPSARAAREQLETFLPELEKADPSCETVPIRTVPPPLPSSVTASAIDTIIARAQRLEQEGKDVLKPDSILQIARELDVDSEAVRRAIVEHRDERLRPPAPSEDWRSNPHVRQAHTKLSQTVIPMLAVAVLLSVILSQTVLSIIWMVFLLTAVAGMLVIREQGAIGERSFDLPSPPAPPSAPSPPPLPGMVGARVVGDEENLRPPQIQAIANRLAAEGGGREVSQSTIRKIARAEGVSEGSVAALGGVYSTGRAQSRRRSSSGAWGCWVPILVIGIIASAWDMWPELKEMAIREFNPPEVKLTRQALESIARNTCGVTFSKRGASSFQYSRGIIVISDSEGNRASYDALTDTVTIIDGQSGEVYEFPLETKSPPHDAAGETSDTPRPRTP